MTLIGAGAGSKFRKSDWYSVWQGRRKFDLFPESDDAIHAAQRRLVSRPYAMSTLKELEPYVDSAIHVLFDKLNEMVGQTVDMGNWVQLYAFGKRNAKNACFNKPRVCPCDF